jgi:hypothetical protein
MNSTLYSAAAVTVCLLASVARAEPVPDALRAELQPVAQDIKRIITKFGGGNVAVGEFTGSAVRLGHAGPQVQLVLTEELTNLGVTVSTTDFRFEVSGKYVPFTDTVEERLSLAETEEERRAATQATGLNCIRLVTLLSRKNGQFLSELPTGRLIFGPETVPAMEGINLSGPPQRDPQAISEQIAEARTTPQVQLQGTKIKGTTGKFEIEVLVKRDGGYVALPVDPQAGEPFVKLSPNDIYGIRLTNNADFEAAVNLRIDGVNCFAFSVSQSQYWILAPGTSTDILGWHRSNTVTTEFKVVANFPDTAAAKLKLQPSESIGLITASFSACWKTDAQRPQDEPNVDGRGTGFGEDIDIGTEGVMRTIGQVRDVLCVRYEK